MIIDRSKIANWLLILTEAVPLVVFSYSGRLGLAYPQRFYLGAGFAVLCTAVLAARRWSFNPLFVAANIWLCLEAVAILSGPSELLRLSLILEEAAFFATMLGVGLVYLAVSPSGLFARGGEADRRVREGSLLLLGLIAAGLVWSLVWRGDELLAAVVPATVVFLVQQLWPVRQRAWTR